MGTLTLRRATLDDAPVLAATVAQGFDSYRAFAPRGWTPPEPAIERARIAERLRLPDAWCLLACDGDAPAGHVALLAARAHTEARAPIPGLAHLWMLFVRVPWWGSGLASRLLAGAVEEAAARGFAAIRLHTPAGQSRARAFYEREGWATRGDTVLEPMLGLEIVEYRRTLRPAPRSAA